MNILVTLPAGIVIIIALFVLFKQVFAIRTLVLGGGLALFIISILGIYSVLRWPGADVFAIHLALYLMTTYALSIIYKVREEKAQGSKKGFHWAPALILGFFAIVIITNTFFILLAQSDGSVSWIKLLVPEPRGGGETRSVFPGTVSHDFRERENQFNEYQQQRRQQEQRGWQVKPGWKSKPLAGEVTTFLLQINDADGKPIKDALVTGKFLNAADFRLDQEFTMQSVGKGQYQVDVSLAKAGSWNLVVNVKLGQDRHELRASTTVY